jgi:carbonic anhydrase/acetyltransferase-like protein (isoleucine patch superfamily)
MGSVVMDGCIVESNSIIAAGSVLTQGTFVAEGSVFAGIPAKKIKDINPELSKNEINRIAKNYILYSSWYEK